MLAGLPCPALVKDPIRCLLPAFRFHPPPKQTNQKLSLSVQFVVTCRYSSLSRQNLTVSGRVHKLCDRMLLVQITSMTLDHLVSFKGMSVVKRLVGMRKVPGPILSISSEKASLVEGEVKDLHLMRP